MPFDIGDHPAWLVPGGRLILEVPEEPFDLGQRRPPSGPGQPMHNLVLEHRVPERGRERYQSAFAQLSPEAQHLVLHTYARFATGEERPDIALAASTVNLYFQIQGLVTYTEENVFP